MEHLSNKLHFGKKAQIVFVKRSAHNPHHPPVIRQASKNDRKSVERLSNIYRTSIDVYRKSIEQLSNNCRTSIEHLSMPMHSHGCLWMSTDIRRKSKITDLASIENRKSNYSIFFFPLLGPNSRRQQCVRLDFVIFFFSRHWWQNAKFHF